ncbi:MAG: rhodanese-like domain-containing protein [Sulfolobales archaeon]
MRDLDILYVEPEDLLRGVREKRYIPIDVRTFTYYTRSHVPSSVWLYVWDLTEHEKGHPSKPKDISEIAVILGRNGVSREDQVVIVYDEESIGLASYLYWYLYYLGQNNVKMLRGGFEEWMRRGMPVEKGILKPTPSEYKPLPRENVRAFIDDVIRISRRERRGLLLDVRTYEEYTGALKTTRRAGRIPGSVWVPLESFLRMLRGDEKAFEEVLSILRSSRGELEGDIITYCTVGVRSSVAWVALKILGGLERVKLYPESFYEYSLREDLDIEI